MHAARFFAATAAVAAAALGSPAHAEIRTVQPFGDVHVSKPQSPIGTVALVLSGEAGWNADMDRIAALLTAGDTLVIGIDTTAYLRDLEADHPRDCINPVPPMIDLAKAVERDNGITDYMEPMIVGYSLGATLAYTSIAEAPPLTFKGGTGLSFCPKLTFDRPLCSGAGGLTSAAAADGTDQILSPVAALPSPFSAVLGEKDTACDPKDVSAFIAKTNNADITLVKDMDMGHALPVSEDWEGDFVDAYGAIAGADSGFKQATDLDAAIADLPLTEVTGADPRKGDTMVLFLSGDGGWADLDQGVAEELARQGMPVIGLSSLKYFWTQRTPDGTAADMARVLRHYLTAWRKNKVMIAGYSFGADVAGFVANGLPDDLKPHVTGIALISPSHLASFEFHLTDWVADSTDGLPTLPQVQQISAQAGIACVNGSEETDSLCPDLKTLPNSSVHQIEGGHHMGGRYGDIARYIAAAIKKR